MEVLLYTSCDTDWLLAAINLYNYCGEYWLSLIYIEHNFVQNTATRNSSLKIK